MKDTLKKIALALWMNHKKKIMAFIFGLLLAGIAALSGIPIEDLKEAAHEASKPAVTQPVGPGPASLPVAPTPAEVTK